MKTLLHSMLIACTALPLCSIAVEQVQVPEPVRFSYTLPGGGSTVYLEQAPKEVPAASPILIYMHGATGDETQGMTLFPSLRVYMAQHNWIYVCPRDYEFIHLVTDLLQRHGERKIYLAGASRGGYMIYQEVRTHPSKYDGMIQIGSALYSVPSPRPGEIVIPTYFIYGDSDPGHSKAHRRIIAALETQDATVLFNEKENAGHEAPYGDQSWWPEALRFVAGLEVVPVQ